MKRLWLHGWWQMAVSFDLIIITGPLPFSPACLKGSCQRHNWEDAQSMLDKLPSGLTVSKTVWNFPGICGAVLRVESESRRIVMEQMCSRLSVLPAVGVWSCGRSSTPVLSNQAPACEIMFPPLSLASLFLCKVAGCHSCGRGKVEKTSVESSSTGWKIGLKKHKLLRVVEN